MDTNPLWGVDGHSTVIRDFMNMPQFSGVNGHTIVMM